MLVSVRVLTAKHFAPAKSAPAPLGPVPDRVAKPPRRLMAPAGDALHFQAHSSMASPACKGGFNVSTVLAESCQVGIAPGRVPLPTRRACVHRRIVGIYLGEVGLAAFANGICTGRAFAEEEEASLVA